MPRAEDETRTDTLDSIEREALGFFLQYRDEVQFTLRNPTSIMAEEELTNFKVFLRYLDDAICKSSPGEERILFRGVRGDYTEKLLFLLAVPPAPGQEFSPHILQDPSYPAFTPDLSTALDQSQVPGRRRVVFVFRCRPDDDALFLGGKAGEVLFPRNTRWITTGFRELDPDIVSILIEKFEAPGVPA